MRISTLRKRAEFQRVRGGGRCSLSAFVLEGKPRPENRHDQGERRPRFGFTVTKKLGGAVVRNRIRRRLKAAISEIAPQYADPTFDYVVVARAPALDMPYTTLNAELTTAFKRVMEGATRGAGDQGSRKSGRSEPRSRNAGSISSKPKAIRT